MPKRRNPAEASPKPTPEQVEAFAAGATSEAIPATPNPSAPHDFKAIRVGLNEYEYQILEAASLKAGRSKLNFIRHAVLKMAEEMD